MDILTEWSTKISWLDASPDVNLAPAVLSIIGVAVDERGILSCNLEIWLRAHYKKLDNEAIAW